MIVNEAQPIMTLLPFHIIAGFIGLGSGAVALFARKGATLHRKSGMIFVYAMLVMAGSGAVMAATLPSQRFSVIAGVLTFYLVSTALLTVRPRAVGFRWVDLGAMLVALGVGIAGITLGLKGMNNATGTIDGQAPSAAGFIFGAVALLAALGDTRMILSGGIQGAQRIARHLWRMGYALFIATASFFLGQAQLFPEPVRNSGLLAIPVLLVLLLLFYWLARVLFTRWYQRGHQQVPTDVSAWLDKASGAGRSVVK
ncbi:MAG: hypothetical protein R3264_11120 [Anaerolineae bacterium]|nr:hypothetical protein [Anaerolineae bacterium]